MEKSTPPTCPCPMYDTAVCPCEYCAFEVKPDQDKTTPADREKAR